MTLWIVIGALALAAGVALALPLLRPGRPRPSRDAYDSQVYRDQLAELERDIERGAISAEEAVSARTEISRRLLAADSAAQEQAANDTRRIAPAEFSGLTVALTVPACALAIYAILGSPSLPGRPAQEVRATHPTTGGAGQQATEAELIARLARALESRPDDLRGWSLYANSLATTGRYNEAIGAFQRVVRLAPKDAALRARYAETVVFAADGKVVPIARVILKEALTLDPKEPRARYYQSLADYQDGKTEDAIRKWLALEAETPPGAEWRRTLGARISDFAREAGISSERMAALARKAQANKGASTAKTSPPLPAQAPGPAPGNPTAEQMQAAQQMSSGDRQAMIRGMVEGLAEKMKDDPNNLEGWLRLARSYSVLGETEKSYDAFERAVALKPGDAELLAQYAESIARSIKSHNSVPPKLVEVSNRLLALQPNHGPALWFTANAMAASGDTKAARERFTRLLGLLDPATPQHRDVKAKIDALPAPKN